MKKIINSILARKSLKDRNRVHSVLVPTGGDICKRIGGKGYC